MIKKVNLLLCSILMIGGCNVRERERSEEVINSTVIEGNLNIEDTKEESVENEVIESLKKPYVYENIKEGLLNVENEFGVASYYMLLDKDNKKVGDRMKPTYIVIHNTANSAPAVNEVKYLNSRENNSSTSFHFAVDDTGVYQAVNLKYNSWHAGNVSMNRKSIGIEIAKSTINDNAVKDKAIENGAKLTAMLMNYYNIPLENVITHKDVTGKNCPHDILSRYGYDNFLLLVKNYLA